MPSDNGLIAEGLTAGYGGLEVIRDIGLQLRRGGSVAVIGPNGAGKSTLLKTLTGQIKPQHGWISLDGRGAQSMSRRELARRIAVVPQSLHVGFGLSAFDVASLGRTPYIGILGTMSSQDRQTVRRALSETNTLHLADRSFATLSGGEAQRVVLAMALAQETDFLLLDEPTVHLDLGQQWRFLSLLSALRRSRGTGVLAILHDLSLAGSDFDQVILMAGGRVVASGRPHDVLTEEIISAGFQAPVKVWHDENRIRVALRHQQETTD